MNIDLNKFMTEDIIKFDESISFSGEDLKSAGILDMKECKVVGFVSKLGDTLYQINMKITGIMVLECSRSLESVDYKYEINIDETFDLNEDNDENLKINANILDIFPIIWENIVLEKPSRIIKEDSNIITSGDGWSLTDEIKRENNSQLSELNKLLDMEE